MFRDLTEEADIARRRPPRAPEVYYAAGINHASHRARIGITTSVTAFSASPGRVFLCRQRLERISVLRPGSPAAQHPGGVKAPGYPEAISMAPLINGKRFPEAPRGELGTKRRFSQSLAVSGGPAGTQRASLADLCPGSAAADHLA